MRLPILHVVELHESVTLQSEHFADGPKLVDVPFRIENIRRDFVQMAVAGLICQLGSICIQFQFAWKKY